MTADREAAGHLATPWAIETWAELRMVSDPSISPDGRQVAFGVAAIYKPSAQQEAPSQIWGVESGGGRPYPLTAPEDGGRDLLPSWSPLGDQLAFLSDRADPNRRRLQIYLLPAAGGEVEKLTDIRGSIIAYKWSNDGSQIFVLASEGGLGDGSAIRMHEGAPERQRLWSIPSNGGRLTPISPSNLQIWDFAVAPDDRSFAVIGSAEPWAWSWYQSKLYLLREGVPSVLFDPGRRQLARPVFSRNGSEVLVISNSWSDRGCVLGGDVYLIRADERTARNLTPEYEGGATCCSWSNDGSVVFSGYEGCQATIGRIAGGGPPRILWKGPASFLPRLQPLFHRVGDELAFVREDFTHAPDVWLANLIGDGVTWRQLTRMNPHVDELKFAESSVIRWKSPDGLEIEGILVKPLGFSPKLRYPLVVGAHGGPTNMASCRIQVVWEQVLAAHGCAVLWPNFRGSTGRGVAFSEANLGDMGGGDFVDLMAGIDHCIALGVADPDRLGITGQSYGGFLTSWAITQTDRFKAAVAGASITNWLSFHGTSRVPTWDSLFMNASPRPEGVYLKYSPVTHAHRVKTPTLFLHGALDEDVPVGQSLEMFRALKDNGVETALRIYPSEAHGFRERANAIDRDEQTVAWLARHLELSFGPHVDSDVATGADGSPSRTRASALPN